MGHCMSCTESHDDNSDFPRKNRRTTSKKGGLGLAYSPAKLANRKQKQKRIGKDNFKILKVIGRGSYGKVYLVELLQEEAANLNVTSQSIGGGSFVNNQRGTGKYYAMKVMKKELLQQAEQVETVMAERAIMAKIDHPFIVKLHYAFQTSTKLYLIMDFINGGELFFHLKRENRFSEDRVKFYAAETIIALEHLHIQGILYRDLKPENILLDHEGHIKLTDFGLSKEGMQTNATYSFCGTPEYLAPEIIKGVGHTKAVDWWSLGLVMFEMLNGHHPFKIKNKNKFEKFQMIIDENEQIQLPHSLSPTAKSILRGLLQKDPLKRFTLDEIKGHEFFSGLDWNMVLKKNYEAPFKPLLMGLADTSNIDRIFTREVPQETPEAESKLTKHLNGKFDGFSFSTDDDKKILLADSTEDQSMAKFDQLVSQIEKIQQQ